MLRHAVLRHAVLRRAVLRHAMLRRAVLRLPMLCRAALCYAVLLAFHLVLPFYWVVPFGALASWCWAAGVWGGRPRLLSLWFSDLGAIQVIVSRDKGSELQKRRGRRKRRG